ncbi:MAG: hypothetical protein LBU61_06855 [Coriobacteriales bacterium]|jgi:hypothetical protein|nr:hypothetical protein [Coriobacteriales bacterium]
MNNTILQQSINANVGMTIDIPDAGLEGLVVRRQELGIVSSTQKSSRSVFILSDYRYISSFLHDSYLAVNLTDRIVLFEFRHNCYEDVLYLCDVDGDGLAEIIVQQDTDMFGGMGQYQSTVFKIYNDELIEIFGYPLPDPMKLDTGFTSQFLGGYRLEISNTITGYNTILDISDRYFKEAFDEEGRFVRNERISCDHFNEFKPEDIDGDGVFEIVCL